MTLKHYYDGNLVTTGVQLVSEKGIASAADLFNPEIIQVVVDDPTASRTFAPFKSWRIVEDAAPSGNQTVWYGFVGRQAIRREGDGVLYPAGRAWHLTLNEAQTLAARRLLRESEGAKRPAETVSTRLTWLLTTAGFSGIIVDHGNVVASSVALEEASLVNQYGTEVLQELALRAGFNAYARYREASSDLELFFYDPLTAATRDLASISLSNNPSGINLSTVFPLSADAEWQGIPDRIAATVAVPTPDTTFYATSAATEAAYAAIDQIAPDGEVKDAASAADLGSHLLNQHSTQEEEWRTRVRVPADTVNAVHPGQAISVTATHVPGYTSGRVCRVQQRSVSRPPNLTQDEYDLDLVLYPMLETTATVAQISAPQSSQYTDGGLFDVHFDHDGDNPRSGCSAIPLTGLASYQGASGERTGIVMDGSGNVDVNFHGTIGGSSIGGSYTFDFYVYLNGTQIGHETYADPDTGVHAFAHTWDIDVNVDVVQGDVISGKAAVTPEPPIFVIPGGVGDCESQLYVSGGLVAR